jgi:heme oxygenase (biliverdin-IX-beta and delta-forming)
MLMDKSNGFLTSLRNATDPEHKALEALPLSLAIVSPQLNEEQYTEYLRCMAVTHSTIEKLVFPLLGQVVTDIQGRSKTGALRNDLQLLGTDFPVKEADTDGFVATPAFALGVFYVAEGSTLGGRVILKNLQKVLTGSAAGATEFFEGYGDQTGPKWKQFISDLTAFEEKCTPDESSHIIEGAKFGFALTASVFESSTLITA